jgi:hypothetical protein
MCVWAAGRRGGAVCDCAKSLCGEEARFDTAWGGCFAGARVRHSERCAGDRCSETRDVDRGVPFVAAVVRPVEAVEVDVMSNAHRVRTIQSSARKEDALWTQFHFGRDGGRRMRGLDVSACRRVGMSLNLDVCSAALAASPPPPMSRAEVDSDTADWLSAPSWSGRP